MKKPNDKSSALRFLLLRYIFSYKSTVSDHIFNEVNNSLKVHEENEKFYVSWTNNNINYETTYELNDFNFFVRGDRDNSNKQINANLNHINATSFAKKALLTNRDKITKKNEKLFTINNFTLFIIPLLLIFILFD